MATKSFDIYADHPTSTEQADRMVGVTMAASGNAPSGKVRVTWDNGLPIARVLKCVRACREELENRGVDRLAFVQG
jgi:hypothetical protein